VIRWFNNNILFAYGYILKFDEYEDVIAQIKTGEIARESVTLKTDDGLEASNRDVLNDQGEQEPFNIINTTPDEGGDILETIFGEEESPAYMNSLAEDRRLYPYLAVLANATQDVLEIGALPGGGFGVTGTAIRPWLEFATLQALAINLRNFLTGQPVNPVVPATLADLERQFAGGNKKANRTKKKRDQKKHTKKIKFRKAPKSKKHRETKRKGK